MDEIVRDFLTESNENLDRLDQELVQLESEPTSKPLLDSIFRTIHTIKGSCGFLGFTHLQTVAHTGESLLSKLRDGEFLLNPEITSGLLAMVDAIRKMLSEIQYTEHDGNSDYPDLLARLKQLQGNKKEPASETAKPAAAPTVPITAPASEIRILEAAPASLPRAAVPLPPAQTPPPAASASAPTTDPQFLPSVSKIGGVLVDRGSVAPENLTLALQEQDRGDRRRLGEILIALGFCRPEDVDAAQKILESRVQQAAAAETVRVGVDLLDTLMNLVGELVLARNQLLQASASVEDGPLQSVSQRMNLIVTEVQEQVMKTRMQPISNVWNKFPRTVRDLALSCGKEVNLEMEGQDTELDRTIIEAIKDPLTHLVRNAIDHGIETPEARRKAGKDPAGRLTLRAFHEGGRVNLEISDDGAGLNADRLLKKAIERGLVPEHQAKSMAERDIFNLIFLPGFSTAEKVTNVSGRGVGMDVVRTNVEKISGAIDLESATGKGTTVRVSIPLTLAIVPALIVNCRDERFAIPQVSVLELVGLDSGDAARQIELVHGAPVYRLRGNLLPLVHLDRELRFTPDDRTKPASGSIVVLQAESRQFGLVVDDIVDTQEIVVKPLGDQLKGITTYSGATIMGDGRVALILDVVGLAHRAKVVSEAREAERETGREAARIEAAAASHSLLIARNGPESQVAIPLSAVTRLEGFSAKLIKHVGGREVLQYRDQIIPLLRLSQMVPNGVPTEPVAAADSVEVVIYSEGARTAGLIVDCIVDIVDEHAVIDPLASRPGVVGSFASDDCITELLDLPAIIRSSVAGFSENAAKTAVAG
jgi:two-component system, chemotaxis family, sensor kinase CheA